VSGHGQEPGLLFVFVEIDEASAAQRSACACGSSARLLTMVIST